jgi:hypothetical protein
MRIFALWPSVKDERNTSKVPEIEPDDVIAVKRVIGRVPFYAFHQAGRWRTLWLFLFLSD